MLSTKKFITIVSVALFVFVLIVGSVAVATAESNDVYKVDAVVVSWKTTPLGDIFVEAVDEDGDLVSWYEDCAPHIGDVFTLTFFDYGDKEEAEIIDAYCVERLSVLELIQWLSY